MRRELVALGLQSHVAQEALGAQCLVASEQRTAMSFAVRQEVTHDAQGGKWPGQGWGQQRAAGDIPGHGAAGSPVRAEEPLAGAHFCVLSLNPRSPSYRSEIGRASCRERVSSPV